MVESTYGDRSHPDSDPLLKLGEVIRRTAARGGVVLTPAFAVGRAQSLLYCIRFRAGPPQHRPVRRVPEILDWLRAFKAPPKKSFITHGEPAAADALRQRIERELDWTCHLPYYLEAVNLD